MGSAVNSHRARESRFLHIVVCYLLLGTNAAAAAPAKSVSPCQTGIKASTALLQAARQQVPLTQRSALQAASSSSSRRVVKVTTWQQLVDAVESAAGDGASAGWRVFELQPGASLVASRPLTLQPGMAVVAAGSGQGSTARKVQVSCQQGVASAFVVDLTSSSSSRPAAAAGSVLLAGLSISGCSGSAVVVSGGLAAPQGVQWASLPPGLHLLDTVLSRNDGAVGGAVRVSRAAVYLDGVGLTANSASQLGGGVSLEQGLMVALRSSFSDNTAGSSGQMTTLTAGIGAAIYANSSTVVLANSTVAGNTGKSVGGCAIKSVNAKGLLLAGCNFTGNKCNGQDGSVVGGSYAASMCVAGGASLMVSSNMPPMLTGNDTDCKLAPRHLVSITDTTFKGDAPTVVSCGGSIMLDAAWLEMDRSSISGNAVAGRGGGLASAGSAVVLQDSVIGNLSAYDYGGSVFQLRGRFWASNSRFHNAFTVREGGGCAFIADATEVRLSGCDFERCLGRTQAGALFYMMMYDKPDDRPPVSVHATRVSNCRALRDRGAMNLVWVNITITDSVFEHNEGYYGGVLNTGNGALSVSRTQFINNSALVGGQGGTIYSFDHAGASFTNCTWRNNSAYQGAAVYAATYGGMATWAFEDCIFAGNTADQQGAAVWTSGTNLTFVNTVISDNRALLAAGVFASNAGSQLPLTISMGDCMLQRNSAGQSAGVAWIKGYSNVSLSKCSIAANRAGQTAAGLYFLETPARLSSCVLAGNAARMAPALALQGSNSSVRVVDTRFVDNTASDQAGAVLLMAKSSLTLSRTSFSNNSASTAGGAVLVLDSAQLSCSGRCNFSSNSAALGGAIAVQSGSVSLSDAVLGGNYAPSGLVTVMFGNSQQHAGSGGAVFAANATLKLSRSVLQGNRAEVQGGALQLLSTAAVLTATRLINNKAAPASAQHSTGAAAAAAPQQDPTAGGAILVGLLPPAAAASTNSSNKPTAQLTLQDCVLSSNMAGFGGAIAAVDTAVSLEAGAAATAAQGVRSAGRADSPLSILLAGCSVSNNSAAVAGGGMFTNLRSTSLTLNSSKVTSNTAAQGGGGIAAVTPASLQLASSSVSSNKAAYCAGLLLDSPALKSVLHSSSFERNVAGQQSADGRSFGQLPQWNSTGSGGGLCIIPGGPVAITKSRITQNTALFGAGMFVQDCVSRSGKPVVDDDFAEELLQDSRRTAAASSSSSGSSGCLVSVGSQTVIRGNKASGGSGSALYTTDTAALGLPPGTRAGRVWNSSAAVVTEAGPGAFGTKPSAVLGGFKQQQGSSSSSSSSSSPVLLLESGTRLPAVQLRLVDQLGQELPASLLQQLTIKAQAAATHVDSRSDTNLLGVTSLVPTAAGSNNSSNSNNSSSSGGISFDWLELQGAPGDTLNVSFAVLEAPEVTPAVVQVQLKQCTAGQAVQRGRRPDLYAGCTNCTNPLFSFDPSATQCSTCPPAGTYKLCSGDVVTPADGYWQSNPRSAQLLACPNPAACSRTSTASAQLAAAAAAMSPAQQQQQPGRNLLAVADAQQQQQQQQQEQEAAVASYQQLQCAPGFTGNLCSNCERSSRVTQSLSHTCKACGVSRAGSIALFVLLRLFDLSVVLLSVFLVFKERQRRNMAVNGGLVTSDSIRAALQQGAVIQPSPVHFGPVEVKMVDQSSSNAAANTGVDTFLQLFIEFMQLLSIFRLTRIGVVWRSAAEAVLTAMSIAPISSYGWVSLECGLRQGMAPQQYALGSTLAATFIPVALAVLVCGTVLVRNARQAHHLRYSWREYPAMAPEMLLAAIKALAYGYPVVVGSVLGLFSCKQLDSAASVPGEVNAAVGKFWTGDLDTACFQGTHLTYALAVGVPMLLLIAAYPLVQLLLLRRQAARAPDGLADVSFWANYSVLYQDYRQHMYLWGSVRELRQLLLVALVVILQAYPVQVQMVGGWVLSLVLLLSHVSLLPFRTGLLNGLQTVMLSVICFTFYAGVLLTITDFPTAGAAALQYIAIVFDLLVALVLLGVLIWRARLWLDFDKDGKVTWTDIKRTMQAGGEITGRAASVVARRVASIGSSASHSFRSSSKVTSREGHARVAKANKVDTLPEIDSQNLDGFSIANDPASLSLRDSLQLPMVGSGLHSLATVATNTSLAVTERSELPLSSSGLQLAGAPATGTSASSS